jgi:hypothetical protein
MRTLQIGFGEVQEEILPQLEYAVAFAADGIRKHALNRGNRSIDLELDDQADAEVIERNVSALIERYRNPEFGLSSKVFFEQRPDVRNFDAWSELLERRWVTVVGDGHVILRSTAARLVDAIDAKIRESFVREFNAEHERYPATIRSETLDRCNHFTSFPEHVDFVAHLRADVTNLKEFAEDCRAEGWRPAHHEGRMGPHSYAISPSCCYHCYVGMEGWNLGDSSRAVTTVVGCHRYEGGNLTTMSRLRAFTMREVVWVGHPRYVISSRHRADDLMVSWATAWGLHCTFETANDMFFTDDFSVKASFQRQQEAKRELRMLIPQEDRSISVFSSNFHSNTFGKAFNITAGDRPAASACVGWGYERMAYAIFSQFGLDPREWPEAMRSDVERLTGGL